MVSHVGEVSEKPLHAPIPHARTLCDQREISKSENGFRGPQWRITDLPDVTDRWPVIVALLADPRAGSLRLAALLSLWPAEVRTHECKDEFPLKKRKEITR